MREQTRATKRGKWVKNLRAHQSITNTRILHPHYVVCTGFSKWAMEIRFRSTFSKSISEKSVQFFVVRTRVWFKVQISHNFSSLCILLPSRSFSRQFGRERKTRFIFYLLEFSYFVGKINSCFVESTKF